MKKINWGILILLGIAGFTIGNIMAAKGYAIMITNGTYNCPNYDKEKGSWK